MSALRHGRNDFRNHTHAISGKASRTVLVLVGVLFQILTPPNCLTGEEVCELYVFLFSVMSDDHIEKLGEFD